jgi:hypothetical protein
MMSSTSTIPSGLGRARTACNRFARDDKKAALSPAGMFGKDCTRHKFPCEVRLLVLFCKWGV